MKIRASFIWNIVGIGAYRGAFLCLAFLSSKFNSPNEFGLLSISLLYIASVQVVFCNSLQMVVSKIASQKNLISTESIISSILFLLIVISSVALAQELTLELIIRGSGDVVLQPEISQVIMITNLIFVIWSFLNGILISQNKLNTVAKSQLIFLISVLVNALLLGNRMEELINSIFVSTIISTFYIICFFYKNIDNIKPCVDKFSGTLKILIENYLPTIFSAIVVAPAHIIIAKLIVNKAGLDSSAVFTTAIQWFALLILVPYSIGNALFPHMLSKMGNKDFTISILNNIKYKCNILVLITTLVALLSTPLFVYIYGFHDKNAILVFSGIFIASGIAGIQVTDVYLIIIKKGFWIAAILNLLWSSIYIFVGFILINFEFGALGGAFALVIAYLVQLYMVRTTASKIL